MWGTSSPRGKLTGDFGNAMEVPRIGDCFPSCVLAKNRALQLSTFATQSAISGPTSSPFRPDVCRRDDRRVCGDLGFQPHVKLSRIHRHRVDAESCKFLPYIGQLQYLGRLPAKRLDNGLGCFGGNEHGDPEGVIGVGRLQALSARRVGCGPDS